MPLFTGFAFVIFGFDGSKRNQSYKKTGKGFFFSNYKVASTGCAADTVDSLFNDDLV